MSRFKQSPSSMTEPQFHAMFGEIFEHSPWMAKQTYAKGLRAEHDDLDGLHALMCEVLQEADHDAQFELLCSHPDLAGRKALAGELTSASTNEQVSAGLDHCTPAEFSAIQFLNKTYKSKFGFPFIMAVKGSNSQQILSEFRKRLNNDKEQEFSLALAEVAKIARFRLADLCDERSA